MMLTPNPHDACLRRKRIVIHMCVQQNQSCVVSSNIIVNFEFIELLPNLKEYIYYYYLEHRTIYNSILKQVDRI